MRGVSLPMARLYVLIVSCSGALCVLTSATCKVSLLPPVFCLDAQAHVCRHVLHRHDDAHKHGRIRSLCLHRQPASTTVFCTFYCDGCSRNVTAMAMRLHLASARDAHIKRPFYGASVFHRLLFNELVHVPSCALYVLIPKLHFTGSTPCL
jgi:hypothetical protein